MRLEDIDDHQVEIFAFEGAKTRLAAVRDRDLKREPLQLDLDGHADHRIIIDDENARNAVPSGLRIWFQLLDKP
jgi:hypothetical protein